MSRLFRLLGWVACGSLAGCSAGSGLAAIDSCFGGDGEEIIRCVDRFIADYGAGGRTTQEMLAELQDIRGSDSSIENNCHVISHAIGRWTYAQTNDIGEAFRRCDETCQSGCMHGAVERLFYTESDLANGVQHVHPTDLAPILPGICDPANLGDPTPPKIFQCLHGLGHALLFALDYQLLIALQSCDLLPSAYEQSSCYGGVFMENIVAADEAKRNIDEDDPLFPCDVVAERHRGACYLMQTSVMDEIGLDDEEIGEACLKAGDYAATCFVSFGRDMSSYVRTGDPDRAVEACEVYSEGNEESCIRGVIYALVDNTWTGEIAYRYCNALGRRENKEFCFLASNDYVSGVYGASKDDLRGSCEAWAAEGRELCLAAIAP